MTSVSDASPQLTAQLVQTTPQQPKPKPPKRLCASFLEDFVDPVHPNRRDASLHAFVSQWLESVGSDREKHCRSDSHLQRADGDSISRQLTGSAPELDSIRDADGFLVPPIPASPRSQSRRPGSEDSRSRFSYDASTPSSASAVRDRTYRWHNLTFNHIYIRHADDPLPAVVSSHIDTTLRAQRGSPQPSSDDLKPAMHRLNVLANGCDEYGVADFLNHTIFPNPPFDSTYGTATGLMSCSNALISRHLVPANPAIPYKVTQPKPNKLYGYSGTANEAFTEPQLLAQMTLHPGILNYPEATSLSLRFPFFAIEFKAAGGTRGDLWVAANQCAGASSACLNAVYQLNTMLPERPGIQRIDNISYCITVDNNTAQLYISWMEDDLKYYLQRIDAFLLLNPEHFKSFRNQVRNILDWGKGARLKQIKDALDFILEENRTRACEAAKSRQPPSDGSATSSGKRRKLSWHRNSSRSGSV